MKNELCSMYESYKVPVEKNMWNAVLCSKLSKRHLFLRRDGLLRSSGNWTLSNKGRFTLQCNARIRTSVHNVNGP